MSMHDVLVEMLGLPGARENTLQLDCIRCCSCTVVNLLVQLSLLIDVCFEKVMGVKLGVKLIIYTGSSRLTVLFCRNRCPLL